MSIKARLSTIILLIGAILFLITGFLVWSNIVGRDQHLFAQAIPDSLSASIKVEKGLVDLDGILDQCISSGSEELREQAAVKEVEIGSALQQWHQAHQVLLSLDVGFDTTDMSRLEKNEAAFAGIREQKEVVLEYIKADQAGDARAAYEKGIKEPISVLLSDIVRSMQDVKIKVADAYSTSFADSSTRWVQGLLILAVFSLVILFVSYRMLWNILYSVRQLKDGVDTMGRGDLDHRIKLKSRDELGRLARSFNDMAENLRKTTISRNYVDNILKSMIGSLIVIDAKGKIETVNQAAEILLGYRKEDMCGKSVQMIFDPSSSFSRNPVKELEHLQDQVKKEDALRTSEGKTIPVILTASALRNGGDRIKGYVIGSLDITERKDAELRLANLVEDLDRANRELKDFAYIVSHDLKAPLRAINSLASWIDMDYADRLDDAGREQLQLLVGRVKRMQALIDGILQYSRVGRKKEESEDIDLNELVTDVIDSLAPPEHISVCLEGSLPNIHAGRIRIQQVFQNLIGNAIKYMDKDQGVVKVGCAKENGDWKFFISDNGPGIDQKYYEKVFQVFQTLKARDDVESTGIGLALVKKIVELYKGKIWVESTVGSGSTFSFTLARS